MLKEARTCAFQSKADELPEAAQEQPGHEILERLDALAAVRAELEAGARELDAGLGWACRGGLCARRDLLDVWRNYARVASPATIHSLPDLPGTADPVVPAAVAGRHDARRAGRDLTGFSKAIPRSRIGGIVHGCGVFGALAKRVIPLSVPAILTTVILTFTRALQDSSARRPSSRHRRRRRSPTISFSTALSPGSRRRGEIRPMGFAGSANPTAPD